MNLSDLILAVGDENVQFQPLDSCAISLDWSRKAGGRITFGTEQPIIPGEGTERMGLILWLDRKAAANGLNQIPPQGTTPVLSDRVAELEAFDDGSFVTLDAYNGGAHPLGAWSELTLRFTAADGSEATRRYAAQGSVEGEIAAERRRQVDVEGNPTTHDDRYTDGQLPFAAVAYTLSAAGFSREAAREMWPRTWAFSMWKPKTPRRDLIRAAALIVAEIERLDRAALAKPPLSGGA